MHSSELRQNVVLALVQVCQQHKRLLTFTCPKTLQSQ